MSTAAQVKANRENAQHSTGPMSDAGKEASSLNNFRHGLSGHTFFLLDWEDAEDFDLLKQALCSEHQPTTVTEHILVEKMAQHYWLSQRAQSIQTGEMKDKPFDEDVQKGLVPYIRYQAHHERLFQRALHDLLKLRAERRKEQIGFESQKAREAQAAKSQAQEIRRESDEIRKLERHKVDMDIRRTRLDREKSNAIIRAIAAAKEPAGCAVLGSQNGICQASAQPLPGQSEESEGALGPQLEKIAA
jgi:hypothetical protein